MGLSCEGIKTILQHVFPFIQTHLQYVEFQSPPAEELVPELVAQILLYWSGFYSNCVVR